MSLVHYCFVRRDLPLGVAAAMLVHAAGESAALYENFEEKFSHPHALVFKGCTAVVLEAKNEGHLEKIEDLLELHKVRYVSIFEYGGPYDEQLMAIGLVPTERAELAPILEPFQTLKQLTHEQEKDYPPSDDVCTCSNCRDLEKKLDQLPPTGKEK